MVEILVIDGERATRHTATAGRPFLVKWYPLATSPTGFQPVAGGLLHVPTEVDVFDPEVIELEQLQEGFRYKSQAMEMFVIVLPSGHKLQKAEPGPVAAKVFDGRLAIYWLDVKTVKWSSARSDANPGELAKGISSAGVPTRFAVDDYEYYDVAISYASEDREKAAELAAALRRAGKHVFYDHDDEARLWGKDLATELEAIYSRRARFCLMLVSAHYARKMWTNRERRAALEGAAKAGTYILPVAIEAVALEGIPETVRMASIDQGVDHITKMLIAKLDEPA